MPVVKEHFERVLARYEGMLERESFDQLDRELFEGTWTPSPGLLQEDEAKAVGPMIVELELAVAKRDRRRARRALDQAWIWVRQRRVDVRTARPGA